MVKIVFIHPDLGIGGAERALIDAALALKNRNHEITVVTSHHDQTHCFEETRDGQLNVITVGDWLPRSLFGRFYALFAYIRMIYAALWLILFGPTFHLIFCDQISACIPVLKLKSKMKVLFYCHFPDMLLTDRPTLLKKIYRFPLDKIEEITTGMADTVVVNSKFTAKVFTETFKSLKNVKPLVLYPVPDFSTFNIDSSNFEFNSSSKRTVFLSINRYERKKNIKMAIEALALLRKLRSQGLDGIQLVIAGGFDERVSENVEYYSELNAYTQELNVKSNVSFYRSITNVQKIGLMKIATCLLYTPDKEHFGIVPVEAMFMKLPVIAVNSGGPCETVQHQVTGFLCPPSAEDFARAMLRILEEEGLRGRMGNAAHERAIKNFSFEAFTEGLDAIVKNLTEDV